MIPVTIHATHPVGVQEVANGPPEPWQLTETAGDTHMTLTRSHGSEKLQIDLMVNNQVCKQACMLPVMLQTRNAVQVL